MSPSFAVLPLSACLISHPLSFLSQCFSPLLVIAFQPSLFLSSLSLVFFSLYPACLFLSFLPLSPYFFSSSSLCFPSLSSSAPQFLNIFYFSSLFLKSFFLPSLNPFFSSLFCFICSFYPSPLTFFCLRSLSQNIIPY